MELAERVHSAILEHRLLEPGQSVLIGVSGGVDSMVLLRILHQLNAWKLHVAHFNHCLRAAESDADESFVQRLAEQLRLPFMANRGDVRAYADQHGISIEMAARDLRHKFFTDAALGTGATRIALAHHADDQIETFWLRLLRGDVGPGLTGMRWIRPAAAGTAIQIVRPLLEIPKADLVRFAREKEIPFRDDASNSSPEFLRNRLRLELVARLKTFQPALRDVTLRTASVLAAEKDFLEQSARQWLHAKSTPFHALHPALQREAIRLQLLEHGLKPNFDLIESLRTHHSLPVSISPDQSVARANSGEITTSSHSPIAFSEGSITIDLHQPGRASFDAFDLEWQFVPERGESSPNVEYFDADSIGTQITLRHWRRGDRFHPIGMPSDSKLQDLFTNWKVPAAEKRRRLLATDAHGKIFWVEGLRISELHKVLPHSSRILRWAWHRRL